MKKKLMWKLLCVVFVLTLGLTFTPLITPKSEYQPELMGMPYTLWMSILQSIFLIVLTFIATKIHPNKE